MNIIYTYLLTLPALIVLDYLFLGIIAKNTIQRLLTPAIGEIQLNIIPAVLFYVLYTIGIVFFAVLPAGSQGISKAILLGALFGFFCYMTYELTNFSTIKNWPIQMVIIDIFWGLFVSGLVAAISYQIYEYLK
jgi:uncharacterized membrane protein